MPAGYYPIIYVRGFAATQKEINAATDDPFAGFNLGSTIERPDVVAARPENVVFEGPLVKLMEEWDYVDAIHDGRQHRLPSRLNTRNRTLWIFDYYTQMSTRFDGHLDRRLMPELAKQLYNLIGKVLQSTRADKVHLVAHSMGGLICRCLIQHVYPNEAASAKQHSRRTQPQDEIARLFTYGTPHGGIELRSALKPFGKSLLALGPFGTDVFSKSEMFRYLTPTGTPHSEFDHFNPRWLENFPTEDACCLVGTNSADYTESRGWSKRCVGTDSDGLVKIHHAQLENSTNLMVHRSHSGPFGLVNSSEGYRHLSHFLFGGAPLRLQLRVHDRVHGWFDDHNTLHANLRIARQGEAEYAFEATRAHFCPIEIDCAIDHEEPVLLVDLPMALPAPDQQQTFRIQLELFSLPRTSFDLNAPSMIFDLIPVWSGNAEIVVGEGRTNDGTSTLTLRATWLNQGDAEWAYEGLPLRLPELPNDLKIEFPRMDLEFRWGGTAPAPEPVGRPKKIPGAPAQDYGLPITRRRDTSGGATATA